ncbi:cytosine permease [Streptomyces bicolor]|uniref:cytosine permease n=1 Tax=Streptomyces bicolor TaxID=66874 RepID=UPI0004E1BB66|nr:cytosine permease [Streptomyces bicolor]
MMLPTLVIGLGLAVTASQDFTGNLTAFLSFMLLLLISWGAVNLVDFYLVQHGECDVQGMYIRSGKYWRDPAMWTHNGVDLKVLTAFVIGVVSGIPAMSNAWYVGPVARHFSNADLSWIPGMVVTSVVCLTLVRVSRGARGESFTAVAGRQQKSPLRPELPALVPKADLRFGPPESSLGGPPGIADHLRRRSNPPQARSGNKGLEQCGNAVDDPSFWTTRHGGRTPTE